MCDEKFRLRERQNGQIKGKMSRRMLILTQYNPMFVPSFKILGVAVPEKSLTQISICITLE